MHTEIIRDLGPWMEFIKDVNSDPAFACPCIGTPHLFECNLLKAVNHPGEIVLGVLQEGRMAGLFVLIVSPEEQYVEMKVDISRSAAAYEAMIDYMQEQYPGFHADFVFNPANRLLKDVLIRKGAEFDPEQVKMVFSGCCPAVNTDGIELLSERYKEQYLAMHRRDVYWTGEKVIETDRFRVFIAVENGKVEGLLDVTCNMIENEPYDLQVKDPARESEWGRKLLAKALEMNQPNGMMVLADVENTAEAALYESVGFEKVPGQNFVTATWILPPEK